MNFLLIRFSSLGDVLLTTSVARNIKNNNPQDRVDILTKNRYASVFLNNPNIERVITKAVRDIKYDYIIDLHDSLRSNVIKYLIPAKKRLTYYKAALARRIYLHSGKKDEALNKNVIDRYLEPLKSIDYNAGYLAPEIFLETEEIQKAESLTESKNYVAIAPGAKWKTKQWVIENYISLIIKIRKELEMNVVLIGDKEDMVLAEDILKGVGLLKKHVMNLTGVTDIRELFAVIKNSRILVTMDSAPLHIGWAAGTNTVALFGPTVKEFGFQPLDPKVRIIEKDMGCRPCSLHGSNKCKFEDRACMQRIEVYEVLDEIKKFL